MADLVDHVTSPGATPGIAAVSRRGVLVLSGVVVGASAVPAVAGPASRDTSVPTWEKVHGYELGSRQASVHELEQYVAAVAKASTRVRARRIATSIEGRPITAVVVTSTHNQRRLPAVLERLGQLRDRPTTHRDASRLSRDLPAVVVALANVHGNEPSGAEALMQVLYDLASGTDHATKKRLDEIVLVLSPTQNPDGRESDARPNADGFDLNRDWFSMTQPESPARIALYREYPAVVGLDLHEQFFQGPDAYFFPPNADPVHREVSRPGLRAANDVLSPAIAKRFDARGWSYSHYGIYDLFAPIYGDSVPNQAFGAAGFLMEIANEQTYPNRVARVYQATDAALGAVVEHREKLLRRWARQWVTAVAEGEQGRFRPQLTQDPASPPPEHSGGARVYAYAIRADRRPADVAHLVKRLLAYGVQVHVTRRGVQVPRLRPFGGSGFDRHRLPAGTLVVSAAQPMKSWVHLMLEDQPHAPLDYYYDVSGWGNALLMRLEGGAIGSPVTSWFDSRGDNKPLVKQVRSLRDLVRPPARDRDRAGYAFTVDSAHAQRAVFALLSEGVEVRRTEHTARGLPAGTAVVDESAYRRLAPRARSLGIPVSTVQSLPHHSATTALRRPRVALVRDLLSDILGSLFARSSGYAEWLLRERFGLDVTTVYAQEIDLLTLPLAELTGDGFDAVVVPDGFSTVLPGDYPNLNLSLPGAGMTPVGLLQLNRFVADGGTYIGWGQQGVSAAIAAGIGGDLAMSVPLTGLEVPGSPFRVHVRGGDPATLGLTGSSTVFNVRDPILSGGRPLVTYPKRVRSYGFASGTDVLAGSVAVSGLHLGSGRAYACAFDPAFRGWSEAAQALVGNMLLAPPPGPGGDTVGVVRPVQLDTLSGVGRGGRAVVVRVGRGDQAALRSIVASASGVPADRAIHTLDDGSVELRVPDARTLSGHPPAWLRRVLERLAGQGVRPTLVLG
ncbi:hypothetical protein BH09ACT12_BH09ACT12_11070 [soil metagenome]